MDEEHRPFKLMLHVIGEDADSDEVVLEEEDGLFCVDMHKTQDHKFLVVIINPPLYVMYAGC